MSCINKGKDALRLVKWYQYTLSFKGEAHPNIQWVLIEAEKCEELVNENLNLFFRELAALEF